jgi:predicted amidophosphoribosyltransferase
MLPHPEVVSQSLTVGVPVYAACQYDAPTSGFVIAYKDREAWQLTATLGELLLSALGRPPPDCVIVPVPSSPNAVRQRGFDHMGSLARWVAKRSGVASVGLLRYVRAVEHVGLSATQRKLLTRATMRASPGRRRVVLVDDVTTTGASLAEARRALLAAGHEVCYAATIAHVLAPQTSRS